MKVIRIPKNLVMSRVVGAREEFMGSPLGDKTQGTSILAEVI